MTMVNFSEIQQYSHFVHCGKIYLKLSDTTTMENAVNMNTREYVIFDSGQMVALVTNITVIAVDAAGEFQVSYDCEY